MCTYRSVHTGSCFYRTFCFTGGIGFLTAKARQDSDLIFYIFLSQDELALKGFTAEFCSTTSAICYEKPHSLFSLHLDTLTIP
jgi:hypothetical protein